MKKHAYLIIAHNQPQLLEMLCQLLDHPNHDIFIHVHSEAKGFDFEHIKNAVKHSAVSFIPRTAVRWGSYSLVNCEMRLLKAAAEKGEYSYYHLVSGADLPLKNAQQLYDFFEASDGREFVDIRYGKDKNWDAKMEKRIRYYYPFRDAVNVRDNIIGLLENKLVKLQQKLGVNRLKDVDKGIASGSQWFSITNDLADFVLQNGEWVEKHFRYGGCGDELFLQMLIRDTEFESRIYSDEENHIANMRFIDWKRGNPYTFKEDDFEQLVNSGYMFARKFDIVNHSEICKKIYSHLTAVQEVKNAE